MAKQERLISPAVHTAAGEFDSLAAYLLDQSRLCTRPPIDRFEYPWIAPMPTGPTAAAYLESRKTKPSGRLNDVTKALARPDSGDGFAAGDYSLGLFHHDVSEASIELLQHPELREPTIGSFLCFLDCADPSGCIHRAELPHKCRDREPAKPLVAQFALRIVNALGPEGVQWAKEHQIFPAVVRFVHFLEEHYTGGHGLFLTHSSRQSGFDSDILTAGWAEKSIESPDANALMVLEYEALGALCQKLGEGDALRWSDKAQVLRERIERLMWWEDGEGGYYVGLRWQHGVGGLEGEIVGALGADGSLHPYQSWAGLLPLYAGIPSAARAERIISGLLNPASYWGPWGVRTAPADQPYFHQAPRVMVFDPRKGHAGPVSNWSGPVWILSNYYLAKGLARYGHLGEARELALKSARLLAQGLKQQGGLRECYDDLGRGLWPPQGTFLSWNVLALAMLRELSPA